MSGYEIAKKYKGMHENKDTKKLDDFINKNVPGWKGLHVNSTPWCAGFVGACEVTAGNKGTQKLNARSYQGYGTLVYDRASKKGKITNAKPGDIAVFERGGSSWQGHVAYVDGIENTARGLLVRTLGGNQSDSVSIGWYPVGRLLSIRRP